MDKEIEDNIKAMSAEEIKDRLNKKYFSPDAENFARKLLKSKNGLKNSNRLNCKN